MFRVSESSSDEETNSTETISSKIRLFIRMKEADSHRVTFLNLNGNSRIVKRNQNCRVSDQEDEAFFLDYDSNSSLDYDDHRYTIQTITNEASNWRQVWNTINERLKVLKQNEQNHKCLEISTSILKLHIQHRLILDIKCYSLLLHCIRPEFVAQVFEAKLIDKHDMYHIGCLFECEDLFSAINEYADDIETTNKYAVSVLKSISVLFYKYKSKQHSRSILKSLRNVLALFINREDNDTSRTTKVKQEINKSIRLLLTACVLNGVADRCDLYDFLMIKNYESISVENSSIENETSSSEEDERVPLYFRVNRNRVIQAKNISERIDLKITDLKSLFPLSLQNLARIKVKSQMGDYSVSGVNELTILPNTLKKFVLFEDEINFILSI